MKIRYPKTERRWCVSLGNGNNVHKKREWARVTNASRFDWSNELFHDFWYVTAFLMKQCEIWKEVISLLELWNQCKVVRLTTQFYLWYFRTERFDIFGQISTSAIWNDGGRDRDAQSIPLSTAAFMFCSRKSKRKISSSRHQHSNKNQLIKCDLSFMPSSVSLSFTYVDVAVDSFRGISK